MKQDGKPALDEARNGTGNRQRRGSREARASLLNHGAWPFAAALSLGLCLDATSAGSTNMTVVPSISTQSIPSCQTDLTSYLEKLRVPGLAAAIIKDGRVVCTGTAGMADIAGRRPVTEDTLFLVASVSKTVTATALMQLAERGDFALDDDINRYLPFDIDLPGGGAPISFRQLLTHTGSIRDNDRFIDGAVTFGSDSPISLASLARGYLSAGGPFYNARKNFQRSAPGTKAKYSNMGITLVGYLVEVISGQPFDAYCRDHIFNPLGMNNTTWRLAETDRTRLAVPYERKSSGFRAYDQYGEPNYPDGMLRTSVAELSKFLIATMQGGEVDGARILQSETVAAMLSRQSGADKSQGLVWFKDEVGRRTVWGHDGSDDGASATVWFQKKTNQGVILMANGEWKGEEKLFKRLFAEADAY